MRRRSHTPSVRWVMHPSERGQLVALEGDWHEESRVPSQDEVLTRPFLVDPGSSEPVPVRVVQRLEWHHSAAPTYVLVVRRAQAPEPN